MSARRHLASLIAALLLLGQLLAPAGLMPARAADGAFTYTLCTTAGATDSESPAKAPVAGERCQWALAATPALPESGVALPEPAFEARPAGAPPIAAAGPRGPPAAAPPPARAPPATA
ncbi:MAG: hypothetical protein ACK4Z0_03865 [Sphingomonadaceae bacterium]